MKTFITVAGNIGSGKTTLTKMLANHFSWEPYFESVSDNPYLADFYGDMKRWALPLQVYFLSKRYQAHQGILKSASSSIQDRSIYEDAYIFAKALHDFGHMDTRDYHNYHHLFETMISHLEPPDLVVYVRRSLPELKRRIQERGRDYEKSIPEDYLIKLESCYEDWIKSYNLSPILILEADNLDFRDKEEDFTHILERIKTELSCRKGMGYLPYQSTLSN